MALDLATVGAAIKLAHALVKMAADEKLMAAGEARSIVRGMQDVEERIERAESRLARLAHDDGSVRGDSANRDNDGG